MIETAVGERPDVGVEPWLRDSLFVWGGLYAPLRNGEYLYYGERPGTDWHGHGYFCKILTVLSGGVPTKIRLHKHRWLNTIDGSTVHSRPPDDPVLVRFCTLVLFLRVWSWVSSTRGFHKRQEVLDSLEECGSDRTVQRWTTRALGNAMEIQQAIRLSIIKEVEPRPVESFIKGGLSPPDAVTQRRWKSSVKVQTLWQAYAMLLVAARELAQQASYLLAEARRRWPKAEKTFGI
jgi:hypothetical protein